MLSQTNTFEKLREFTSTSYKPKISSRIRFMILDTIELRNNGWVSRNAAINPKTLNELEKEFTAAPDVNRHSSECIPKLDPQLRTNTNVQQVILRFYLFRV